MRRRNPLMKPVANETALVMVVPGVNEVLLILVDAQTMEIYGKVNVYGEGLNNEAEIPGGVIHALALPGYGPLLYDMASWAIKTAKLGPGLQSFQNERSDDANRLWARHTGRTEPSGYDARGFPLPDLWRSPSAQAFKRKYGVTQRSIVNLGRDVMETSGLSPRQWQSRVRQFQRQEHDKGREDA